MKTTTVRSVALAAVLCLSLACAGTAHATLDAASTPEPPTTKGSTNTWWFTYHPSSPGYVMCFTIYKNGQVLDTYDTPPLAGYPGTSGGMCTQRYDGLTQPGYMTYDHSGLEHGAT